MDEYEDLASVMAEPPGGENHGRTARVLSSGENDYVNPSGRMKSLGDPARTDFLHDGGWGVETGTAHRGVLHPDEHVDEAALRGLVERALGFTYEEIASVYRVGRPSNESRQLRDKIDARLLALSRSGGNMLALARVLGWAVEPSDDGGGPSSKTMERALVRARAAEGA